ncbi:MAG: GldG family protein [bacterium]
MRRWTNLFFFALLLVSVLLMNRVATLYDRGWDLSSRHQNSLHPASIELLEALDGPVGITAFIPDYPLLRAELDELLARYKRIYPAITLTLADPSTHPAQARQLGITAIGEAIVEYQGQQKKIPGLSEHTVSNALSHLSMNQNRWIVTLEGHGEASLNGQRNYDLGLFGRMLKQRGYTLFHQYLAEQPEIPDNTGLVILAAPQTELSDAEQQALMDYLGSGGNLLWLAEKNNSEALNQYFDLQWLPGSIVDAAAANHGVDSPTVAIAYRHADHELTRELDAAILLPGARAIAMQSPLTGWNRAEILKTGPNSWNETGNLTGTISRETSTGEQPGPLTIGILLTRELPELGTQQVAIIGDSDWLSNAYLGNGANRVLGLSLINHLTENRAQLDIPTATPQDQVLNWSPTTSLVLVSVFIALIPLLLVGSGLLIRRRRVRR